MKKNAVGYFNHQRSGCFWYRVKHPMQALKDSGVETIMLPINEDIDESIIDSLMSVQLYGSYPFSFEPVLKYLKEKDIKIVYDIDDALDLIDITNPFYYSVKKDVGSVRQILDYVDEVTVSTPKMKEYIENHYDFKGKITILPNCYLASEWTFPRPNRNGIRIGFAGASPHVSDLVEILPVIKNLQSKYDIKFLIMGFGQDSYENWYKSYRYIAQPEATLELRKLDELLKEITYEWIPFVDFDLYPSTLINLALDIGICPLKDTPFNQHRSACKAMEYTLAGTLALASDVEPYRNDINSILIKNSEWEAMLTNYIEFPLLRNGLKDQCLIWTKENRNIENQTDLLKSVYVV